ncbi:MAG TPA: DNRLRE domain-containing protein [Methanothrix sp.]|nr:DNRLRE domain-containing protein [Methanothrix sp.]
MYAFIGIFLLLAATAAAGSFNAEMDVKTYVDADNANQSFSDSDLLWAASTGGQPGKEVYLSIINLFGSQGIFKPEKISSATLTLDAAQVDKPGKIKAYFLHGATLDTTSWLDKDDYDEEVSSEPVEVEDTGSITIDVTPIIQKAVEVCTEGCPYSIVLVAEDDASIAFDSSSPELEYTTQD